MTLKTDSEKPFKASMSISSIHLQLSDIVAEMTAIQNTVREEGNDGVEGSRKLLGELRNWLKIAIETEARIEEYSHKKQGNVRGFTIDLDDARSTIGCRLDRLRRSCCPKDISG